MGKKKYGSNDRTTGQEVREGFKDAAGEAYRRRPEQVDEWFSMQGNPARRDAYGCEPPLGSGTRRRDRR
jgi:hypothetical protein